MTLHTSLGDIKLELYCDRAPKSCENFLALAASNYYDNTVFHRNIKGAAPAALHVPARARRAMAGSSIARGRRLVYICSPSARQRRRAAPACDAIGPWREGHLLLPTDKRPDQVLMAL